MNEPQEPFDRKTWETFVQVDPDIAAAATYLSRFGADCIDDLAASYLGEKRYLAAIVAKIQREAEERSAASAGTENLTAAVNETVDDIATGPPKRAGPDRLAPEFDSAKWASLIAKDADVAAAMASVAPYGSYYVADLAASYLAINDKRYLSRIVSMILAEAEADRMSPANSSSPFEWNPNTTSRARNLGDDPAGSAWRESGVSFVHEYDWWSSSADQDQRPVSFEFLKPKARVWNFAAIQLIALTAFLVVSALADVAYEYSTYRNAQRDVGRLRAYSHQCWICYFKEAAEEKASSLETQAQIAADMMNFQGAQGHIPSLETYLRTCTICAHADAARQQIARLQKDAADVAQRLQEHEQAVAVDTTSFQNAQDNIASLETYLRTCTICGHANSAREQIARLEKEAADLARSFQDERNKNEQDEQAYQEARGDIGKLNAYLVGCSVCAFKSRAEQELSLLQTPAAPAQPPRHVTWRITNSTGLTIGVLFFSQTRPGQAWPGSDMNWPMTPGNTADYNLACETGERICYGAFAPYRGEFWGVGTYGNQACSNCCFLCDGTVHAINLVLTGNSTEGLD